MNRNKIVSAILISVAIMSISTGCSSKTNENNVATVETQTTQEEVKENNLEPTMPDTGYTLLSSNTNATGDVKIMIANAGGKDEQEMELFAKALSEGTGLNIIIDKPAEYDTALIQKLSNGELYDLIYMGSTQMISLEEQGALLDITDRINNSKIFMNNIDKQELEDIKINGKYYAGFNKKEVFLPVMLNKTQLENAGIDYTKIEPTLDGYYETFKTLKESNTDKSYYPYNLVLSKANGYQPFMAHVGAKGGVVVDEADGKTYVPYAQDNTKEVWQWYAKLYEEGLLDPSSLVDQTKDIRNKMEASSQLLSVKTDWIAWLGLHNKNAQVAGVEQEDYYITALPGVMTPDGSYMLQKGDASLYGIPSNAPNPDGAFRVLEYFATQEGGELLQAGIEGYDYIVDENGNKTLTEIGLKHGLDHGAPFPINKHFKSSFPLNPGVEENINLEKYASIQMPIVNNTDYEEIVGKWGVKIIKGDVDVDSGLKSMREELVSRGITQK